MPHTQRDISHVHAELTSGAQKQSRWRRRWRGRRQCSRRTRNNPLGPSHLWMRPWARLSPRRPRSRWSPPAQLALAPSPAAHMPVSHAGEELLQLHAVAAEVRASSSKRRRHTRGRAGRVWPPCVRARDIFGGMWAGGTPPPPAPQSMPRSRFVTSGLALALLTPFNRAAIDSGAPAAHVVSKTIGGGSRGSGGCGRRRRGFVM